MAEVLSGQVSDEEIIEDAMKQGGEVVDHEVAHQVWEMYELSRLHGIEIDENIDTNGWVGSEVLDLLNCKSEWTSMNHFPIHTYTLRDWNNRWRLYDKKECKIKAVLRCLNE